ncbi:MAG: SDR family oxidoreductase [Chloroflexota bacterium]
MRKGGWDTVDDLTEILALEDEIKAEPEVIKSSYQGSGRLEGRVALLIGGDTGIGRSVAVHYAREGADVAIIYYKDDTDAKVTRKLVEKEGRACLLISGDIRVRSIAKKVVERAIEKFGEINILINNNAELTIMDDITDFDVSNFEKNLHSHLLTSFNLTKEVLKYMKRGDSIINMVSMANFLRNSNMVDFSAIRGAVASFTKSLGYSLAKRGIRVNGVSTGPIWTHAILQSDKNLKEFGKDTPMGRAGHPSEVAPAFVFLASPEASYITGQIIEINGGEIAEC